MEYQLNKIAFWLGVGAILLGVWLVIDAALEQGAFDAAGVIAVAIGLVVIAVSRRGSNEAGGGNAA